MVKLLFILCFTLLFKEHVSIRHGFTSQVGAAPYQVAIFSHYEYKCGGSLISENWVLTAASCIISNSNNLHVVLGATNLVIYQAFAVISNVSDVLIHHNYVKNSFHDNIGLIHLGEPVEFSDTISHVSLSENNPNEGQALHLSGYGKTGMFGLSPSPLHEVSVETISTNRCKQQYWYLISDISAAYICTAGALLAGRSACTGDEGSPLVQYIGHPPVPVLVGIVNIPTFACNGVMPTVYTSVAYYHDWIMENSLDTECEEEESSEECEEEEESSEECEEGKSSEECEEEEDEYEEYEEAEIREKKAKEKKAEDIKEKQEKEKQEKEKQEKEKQEKEKQEKEKQEKEKQEKEKQEKEKQENEKREKEKREKEKPEKEEIDVEADWVWS